MDLRMGLGFVAGLLVMWLAYRDWKRPAPRDNWPRIDNSPTGQFKRIVSGRLQ